MQPKRRWSSRNGPQKHFQTVDMSAGNGSYILERAKKFPQRKYAAVDLELHAKGMHARQAIELVKHGVVVESNNIDFLRFMQKEGLRTQNLNAHLPEVGEEGLRMMNELMKLAPKVLVPNGKIFIASVDKEFLSIVGKFAQREGMRWSWRPTLAPHSRGRESDWSQGLIHDPLYRITITCRPRAEQIKERREREWKKRFKLG
jgi:tRNA G46 methylase TrmB